MAVTRGWGEEVRNADGSRVCCVIVGIHPIYCIAYWCDAKKNGKRVENAASWSLRKKIPTN
jgi:uncharacterized membrane protein YuzA (DUF378 family)